MEIEGNEFVEGDDIDIDETPEENSETLTRTETFQPKRRRSLLLCGHCDTYLAKSTYYRHRELHFNPVTLLWKRSIDTNSDVAKSDGVSEPPSVSTRPLETMQEMVSPSPPTFHNGFEGSCPSSFTVSFTDEIQR